MGNVSACISKKKPLPQIDFTENPLIVFTIFLLKNRKSGYYDNFKSVAIV